MACVALLAAVAPACAAAEASEAAKGERPTRVSVGAPEFFLESPAGESGSIGSPAGAQARWDTRAAAESRDGTLAVRPPSAGARLSPSAPSAVEVHLRAEARPGAEAAQAWQERSESAEQTIRPLIPKQGPRPPGQSDPNNGHEMPSLSPHAVFGLLRGPVGSTLRVADSLVGSIFLDLRHQWNAPAIEHEVALDADASAPAAFSELRLDFALPEQRAHVPTVEAEVSLGGASAEADVGEEPEKASSSGGALAAADAWLAKDEQASQLVPGELTFANQGGLAQSVAPRSVGHAGTASKPATATTPSPAAAVALALAALALPFWLLYRRLSRSDDSPARASILAFLETNPGATAACVARARGLHYTTAAHHLAALARVGFVVAVQVGGRRRFHRATGAPRPSGVAVLLAGSPQKRRILEAIRSEPGVRPAHLARALGLPRSSVRHHVDALAAAGVVTIESATGEVRLRPA
ncbi:MAG TPA: helix-turn-helix domain-containing protein [Candidatus Thermoplasmatota archaeon]|nr:helix-turn-helix domain-containing protein [Candidatus Thermoplasmatota archaeon]